MDDNNIPEMLYELLCSGSTENMDLALTLAQGQAIDLEPFWREVLAIALAAGAEIAHIDPAEQRQALRRHLQTLQTFPLQQSRLSALSLSERRRLVPDMPGLLQNGLLLQLPRAIRAFSGLQRLDADRQAIRTISPAIGGLSRLEYLSLQANPLETLPPEIGQLSSLRLLELGNNPTLRHLPPEIGQLSQLEQLSLVATAIESLPDTIGNCAALHTLTLEWHRVALPLRMGDLRRLTTIEITNMPPDCHAFHPTFYRCIHLEHLSACFGQLQQLDPAIAQLTRLQTLALYNNQLQQLPPEIGMLERLESLSLENNPLETLPDTFGQLTALRTLHLDWDKVALPPAIAQCSRLHTISISGRGRLLEHLHPSIGNLRQVESIFLHHNHITALPDTMAQLHRLHTLSIANSRITRLPAFIARLPRLLVLQLDWETVALPTCILRSPAFESIAPYIQRLYHAETDLAETSDVLQRCPALCWVDLRGAGFDTLPEGVYHHGYLSHLEADWATVQCRWKAFEMAWFQGAMPHITHLDLRDNGNLSIPKFIYTLPNLRTLEVDWEKTLFDQQIFAQPYFHLIQHKIQRLACTQQGYTAVPEQVWGMAALYELNLAFNHITYLPPDKFKALPQLEKVYMHGNHANGWWDWLGRLWTKTPKGLSNKQKAQMKEAVGKQIKLLLDG